MSAACHSWVCQTVLASLERQASAGDAPFPSRPQCATAWEWAHEARAEGRLGRNSDEQATSSSRSSVDLSARPLPLDMKGVRDWCPMYNGLPRRQAAGVGSFPVSLLPAVDTRQQGCPRGLVSLDALHSFGACVLAISSVIVMCQICGWVQELLWAAGCKDPMIMVPVYVAMPTLGCERCLNRVQSQYNGEHYEAERKARDQMKHGVKFDGVVASRQPNQAYQEGDKVWYCGGACCFHSMCCGHPGTPQYACLQAMLSGLQVGLEDVPLMALLFAVDAAALPCFTNAMDIVPNAVFVQKMVVVALAQSVTIAKFCMMARQAVVDHVEARELVKRVASARTEHWARATGGTGGAAAPSTGAAIESQGGALQAKMTRSVASAGAVAPAMAEQSSPSSPVPLAAPAPSPAPVLRPVELKSPEAWVEVGIPKVSQDSREAQLQTGFVSCALAFPMLVVAIVAGGVASSDSSTRGSIGVPWIVPVAVYFPLAFLLLCFRNSAWGLARECFEEGYEKREYARESADEISGIAGMSVF